MNVAAGKRVLVTGVDGFTGRHLAPILAACGDEVHGLVKRLPAEPVEGTARLHVCELTDPAAVANAIQAARPQRVVHLAGISSVGHGDVASMYAVNVVGSRHVFAALADLTDAPEVVLIASSANVYGNARAGMLDESIRPAPANDYAVSKLAMEYAARLYSARLPLVICRPFNYTGVGQPEWFLLPKIVAHARRKSEQIELGNLDVARDFSDVRDVAAAYAGLLDTPAAIGSTVNVCSGISYRLREVLGLVEEISEHRMRVVVNPDLVRRDEVRSLCGDRSLLDSVLPRAPRRIELRETLRWMLKAG